MKKRVALVVSTPITFNVFYKKHIEFLKKEYDITLISNFKRDTCNILGLPMIHVDIMRKPSILSDLLALIQLISIFKKEKFDIVHTTTPKAGLLAQLAACLTGVKSRLHFFTGQVWANKTGYKRELLKIIDKIIGFLPTNLLADSFSQRDFLVNEKIVRKEKIDVLGQGSISGVNLNKFYPRDKEKLRREISISSDNFVFLFVGRLNKDKGVLDLLKAFERINKDYHKSILFIVGMDEENLVPIIKNNKLFNKSIFYKDFTTEPENYMSLADVFCLPSYREGFGSVIIEAAACGTPSIGSDIYGLSDSIEDNKTGLLFEVGNINDLFKKMQALIVDKKLLEKLSKNALNRVETKFDENVLSDLLLKYYKNL